MRLYEMVFDLPKDSGASGSRGKRSSERLSSRGNRGCRVRDCYTTRSGNQLTRERERNNKTLKPERKSNETRRSKNGLVQMRGPDSGETTSP